MGHVGTLMRSVTLAVLLAVFCEVVAAQEYCDGSGCDLSIPNRNWTLGHPVEGWCGEACIQMAASHFGLDLTQHAINQVGRARCGVALGQPDLTVFALPCALDGFGMLSVPWRHNGKKGDVQKFLTWIRAEVGRGHPVIVGISDHYEDFAEKQCDKKTYLYPYLNHFVLVVGFDHDSLLINTNYPDIGQVWVYYDELSEWKAGRFTIGNPDEHFFGVAVQGVAKQAEEGPSTNICEE